MYFKSRFNFDLCVCFVSEEETCSKDVQTEVTQLKIEAEQKKKQAEDLMAALEKKKTEAEERLRETHRKDKEVKELRDALDQTKKEMEEKEGELEELKRELDEVNQVLEEKSREADESVDKYCSLLVKMHKLEESDEGLKVRLEQFTATRRANEATTSHSTLTDNRRRSSRKSSSKQQEVGRDGNTENLVPPTAQRSQGSSPGKRGHCEVGDKDGVQEALHNLTKKLKASTMTTPKPRGEEEEFRPEGLPELVQKGRNIHLKFIT